MLRQIDIVTLDRTLRVVCPIHGISIGRWEDKETWRIDYKPEATQAQKDAASAIITTFDPSQKIPDALTTDDIVALLVKKGILTQKDVDDMKATKPT